MSGSVGLDVGNRKLFDNFLIDEAAAVFETQHIFAGSDRLDYLQDMLLDLSLRYEWQLEAWAVFPNHYHFVGRSPGDATTLTRFLKHLHGKSSIDANRWDAKAGRQVWFKFWDTRLTYHRSYLARLNYVHQNAVHHGLVKTASAYRWCSARWFERTCSDAQVRTIYSMPIDDLNEIDVEL